MEGTWFEIENKRVGPTVLIQKVRPMDKGQDLIEMCFHCALQNVHCSYPKLSKSSTRGQFTTFMYEVNSETPNFHQTHLNPM